MSREIAEILRTQDRFLVVTHINPDGDAVGSLLGMALALSEMGKQSWAFAAHRPPSTYDFLQPDGVLVTDPASVRPEPEWIISVDAAEEGRISGDLKPFRNKARLINIDHHITNPGFGDLNMVRPDATSSAELVHGLLKEIGYTPSPLVGKCLYTGLVTDTGGFRFPGVNSRTLLVGAELLDSGFDLQEVTLALYEDYPVSRLYLERLMLERIEVLLDGRVMVSTLYDEDFLKLHAHRSETEDLVNRLRETKGVEVGILLTEQPDGSTRVSLRSKGLVDVSAVAKSMGGGGHHNAAGIKTPLTVDEIKRELLQSIAEALP